MKNKKNINPRLAATQCLLELEKKNGSAKQVLEQRLALTSMTSNDRQLARNLVFGVMRQKQYLDHLIRSLTKKPAKKIHPVVYQSISIGLFQLFCLSRIPDAAAVNESLKVLKRYRLPKRLSAFANWLLRESIRQRDQLPQPALPQHKGDILNHPSWLCDRWESNYSPGKMVEICATNTKVPDLTLRINRLKSDTSKYLKLLYDQDIAAEKGEYAESAIILTGYSGRIEDLPEYDQGTFHVQDQAAQLAGLLLAPFTKNGIYLDGCAGLGGKAIHLAEQIFPISGRLVALEPSAFRYQKLLQNLNRSGLSESVDPIRMDIASFRQKDSRKFDGILIDAPCSGTGVIRRQPDIRWTRQKKDLADYSAKQLEILEISAMMLKPEGILVYATCSIEPEENQHVINSFLEKNPDFSATPCQNYLPKHCHNITDEKYLCPLPSDKIDGFFAARLKKDG